MKYLTKLVFACLVINSSGQTTSSIHIEGLIIDLKIKGEVEAGIKDLDELKDINLGMEIYETKVSIEFYEDDSLIFSTSDRPKGIISKAFYYWRGDTLTIDGGIGLAVNAGFSIRIVGNTAMVYHMVSSDESPQYAYSETTEIRHRLDVPCFNYKAVLSELPEKGKGQTIYGYIEFQSKNYFSRGRIKDGSEIERRKKLRSNMKMYFRSRLTD